MRVHEALQVDARLRIAGMHVYWGDYEIEHINYDAQDSYDWEGLIRRCRHLEWLDVVPRSSTVVWHWSWFEDAKPYSTYLPLLKLVPGLWEHGMTAERAQKLSEANCGSYVVCEPDGSIMFSKVVSLRDGVYRLIRWNGEEACVKSTSLVGVGRTFYHTMQYINYHPAKMGQTIHLGPCYATYPMIADWLDSHAVDRDAVMDIVHMLKGE